MSDQTPLVSVIVPNYNHARFLPERLNSIARQTCQDMEIILLDDASSDSSEAVLTAFAQECDKVSELVINQRNSGRAICQWLKGASLAKGQYIWIAESDDVAEPEFLSRLLAKFDAYPKAGLAYCDSLVIDENGKALHRYDYASPFYQDHPWQQDFVMSGRQFAGQYMAYRNVIPNVSSVLFKASVLKAHIQDSPLKYCADWELYNRILMQHDMLYVHQPLNQFRKHTQSSRWHTTDSYAQERREKLGLLKWLATALADNEALAQNVRRSVAYIYRHRHKHRRIAQVCQQLADIKSTENPRVVLFGANDIAEKCIDALGCDASQITVVDNQKAGAECLGLPVTAVSQSAVSGTDVCVLCTLSHQNAMRLQLSGLGYRGRIIEV